MKWEYNEPHTTNLHSPVEYNVIYTHHEDRQCLFVLELHSDMFLSHINQTWRNSMGIWRNIGKIVTLLFQIVYAEMKWITRSFKRVKRISPKQEVKNIYLNEEQESLERSKLMVDLCEQPYYDNESL